MYAQVGDRLVLRGVPGGARERVGKILFVRRSDGGPPYLVRWADSGHEALVYPGPNARVMPLRRHRNERSE